VDYKYSATTAFLSRISYASYNKLIMLLSDYHTTDKYIKQDIYVNHNLLDDL